MKYIFVFIACLGQCKCQNNDKNVYCNTSGIPKDSASVVKELFRQDSLLSTYEGKGVFKLLPENRYMEYKIVRRDSIPVENDTTNLVPNKYGLYEVHVPLGSRYELSFDEGTKAWLNAGTDFRFKENGIAIAEIRGEGYLRCKSKWLVKAGNHSFTIPAKAEINISCYLKEKHKASMIVGTAMIDEFNIPAASLVKFNSAPIIILNYYEDDPEEPISWTTGLLSFLNKSCEESYRELMRWQNNINISSGSSCLNGGKLNLSMKLKNIIELLELNKLKISYRIDSTCHIIVK